MRLRLKRGFGQTLACAETERKARPFTTACRLCEAATDKQLFLVTFGTPAEASGVWRRCINSLEGEHDLCPESSRTDGEWPRVAWHLCLHMACTDSNHLHNVPLFYFFCAFVFTCFTQPALDRSHPLSLPSLVFLSLHPIKYWIKHGDVSLCLFTQFFLFFFVLDIISVDVSGCIRGHRLASLLRALVCWQLSEPALSFSSDMGVFVSEGSSFIFLV